MNNKKKSTTLTAIRYADSYLFLFAQLMKVLNYPVRMTNEQN